MTTFIAFLAGLATMAVIIWLISRRLAFLAQKPGDYANAEPAFDIRERLNGPLLCDGVIYGPLGRVTSRFTAEFDASWTGDHGRMRETFHYDSGVTQEREWRLALDAEGNITADADDLEGPGKGRQEGAGVRLAYRIKLPESAGGYVLDVVDWMYLLDNGTIMNRSQFRKFGICVAELVATMRPDETRAKGRKAA